MLLLHPASFTVLKSYYGKVTLSFLKAPIDHNVPRNLCETGFHWIHKKTFGRKSLVTPLY